jgi:GNAT superfamily N-acetyltransferase
VSVRVVRDLDGVDWNVVRADLIADAFDNGRTPGALHRSFAAVPHVAIAWDGDTVVGTARLLSDGVCNAYLVDVWTRSSHRRQGVGSAMVRDLVARVPGQHIALQTDDGQSFYESLGFRPQPEMWSIVVGTWLDNDANRDG